MADTEQGQARPGRSYVFEAGSNNHFYPAGTSGFRPGSQQQPGPPPMPLWAQGGGNIGAGGLNVPASVEPVELRLHRKGEYGGRAIVWTILALAAVAAVALVVYGRNVQEFPGCGHKDSLTDGTCGLYAKKIDKKAEVAKYDVDKTFDNAQIARADADKAEAQAREHDDRMTAFVTQAQQREREAADRADRLAEKLAAKTSAETKVVYVPQPSQTTLAQEAPARSDVRGWAARQFAGNTNGNQYYSLSTVGLQNTGHWVRRKVLISCQGWGPRRHCEYEWVNTWIP